MKVAIIGGKLLFLFPKLILNFILGGLSGLSCAVKFCKTASSIVIFDRKPIGLGGASSCSSGNHFLLHYNLKSVE